MFLVVIVLAVSGVIALQSESESCGPVVIIIKTPFITVNES